MKVATFTVHATAEQSRRWKMAAESEGHSSAGTWLAAAADAYLKARARAGAPIPLSWHRGAFSVRLESGELVKVRGLASPPFAYYPGTAAGLAVYRGRHRFTLVHLPDARIIATLRTAQQVRALAAEIDPVLIRGDPVGHRREAV